MPECASSAIRESEGRAAAAQDVADDLESKVAIWFEMEAAVAHLRDLARLREPGIDEDCRLAGCGRYGRSIT